MTKFGQTLRLLARASSFTVVTVLTLAAGIGATSAIFSVMNGALIKPLPFPEAERLVALVHEARGEGRDNVAASPAMYFTYRDNSQAFESVALWSPSTASITGTGDPEEVRRLLTTHEYLPTLGVAPVLGRTFIAADDEPASPGTVIISHGYWQRRFAGSPGVVGQVLTVDGAPHTIVGVLPQQFRFLQQPAEILTPMQPDRARSFVPSTGERGIARLRPGVSLSEASADVRRMIPILFDSFPLVPGLTRDALESMQLGPNLMFLQDEIIGDLADVLWLLMATMVTLLLIACANVANLHLARTEARSQELAVRTALGARGSVLVRDLLWESVVLALIGGVIGLGLAAAALPMLLAVAGRELPGVLNVQIDAMVVVITIAVSIGCGLLFGLASVARYLRASFGSMLGAAGRGQSATRERRLARNYLVVFQVALAVVLLVASGLMIRTFVALRSVDPGFAAPDELLTVRIAIPQASVPTFDRVLRTQHEIADRIAGVAGVDAVGFSSRVPLGRTGPSGPFQLEAAPDAPPLELEFRFVSPEFLPTLGTRLVAGRHFDWTDVYDGRNIVVVSEGLARSRWGSSDAALGERLRRSAGAPWLEVVGVVADVRHDGIELPAPDTVYMTSGEGLAPYMSRNVFFFVRSPRAGTAGFLREVQTAVWSVNADVPLGSVQTLGDIYRSSIARTSVTLVLLSITGGMALLLGLVGVYGVISYLLTQRTREIGIRMALGAQNSQLKRMLVGHALAPVGVGVALGLGGAAALTQLMESMLFGVSALDLTTYAAVAALLVMAAALAGYIPARRVTSIDPTRALRTE